MIIDGNAVYNMSKDNATIAEVESGATLTFITKDCYSNMIQPEGTTLDCMDWAVVNPATGPVYIKDAKPGDVLKVHIDDIVVGPQAVMVASPDCGVYGDLIKETVIKRLPVKDGMLQFSEDIQIPLKPMIGVIGVAAEEGAIPTGEPGSHGSNMDNTKIGKGATLYLPIFHDGAIFALGDVHAAMGDGEIIVTGCEIPAEVTVTVEVLKGVTIDNPRLENDECVYTIASDHSMEKAVYDATLAMAKIIAEKKGMSLEEAGMLMSAAGDLQFCQVVDPKHTVRFEMSKKYLDSII